MYRLEVTGLWNRKAAVIYRREVTAGYRIEKLL
jgi:hypothetical protein